MTTNPTMTGTDAGGATSAGSTTDQAKHVAGAATEEAQRVGSTAGAQARTFMRDARTQVEEQSRTQRDRLVTTLSSLGNDLDSMAEQRSGLAADAARELAHRARDVGSRLEGRDPTDLLDDVRAFARRRPGMFLTGALVAGVVVGRLARGARDAAQSDSPTYPTEVPLAPPVAPPLSEPSATPSGAGPLTGVDPLTEPGYGAMPAQEPSSTRTSGLGQPTGSP